MLIGRLNSESQGSVTWQIEDEVAFHGCEKGFDEDWGGGYFRETLEVCETGDFEGAVEVCGF